MRKIRKIKIPVHHKEIARRIKKTGLDPASAGLSDQAAMQEFTAGLASAMEPGVVFDSFSPAEDEWKKITSMPGLPFSAGAVTLGKTLEEKIKGISDHTLYALARVAAGTLLENGVRFVLGLIEEEAALEGLVLGPMHYLTPLPPDPYRQPGDNAYPQKDTAPGDRKPFFQALSGTDAEAVSALMGRLGCAKVEIGLAGGFPDPEYTVVFSVPWLSRKKSRSSR
ncbi:MAG: hypothetical protein ABIG11_01600 [bacterium]